MNEARLKFEAESISVAGSFRFYRMGDNCVWVAINGNIERIDFDDWVSIIGNMSCDHEGDHVYESARVFHSIPPRAEHGDLASGLGYRDVC